MDTFPPVARAGRQLLRALLLSSLLVLGACASLPRSDVQPASGQIRVAGARGPLSRRQARRVLARLAAQAPDAGALQRHLAIEQAVADSPLYTGNHVRILRDGAETFPAIFAAIRAAKSHLYLEYYIFEDVTCDGTRLSDLLLAKRRDGVAISIIYDDVGSIQTPAALFVQLRDAGIRVTPFNPINPFKGKAPYHPNDRDHRKIMVADGVVAIVGGINLSTSYESGPSGRLGMSPTRRQTPGKPSDQEPWRDTDLEISGPAARQLDRLFQEHWREQTSEALEDPAASATPVATTTAPAATATATAATTAAATTAVAVAPDDGGEVVRIIGSSPRKLAARYYVTVLSAIRNAEQSIWMTAAYFVPTHEEIEDLKRAAYRGVDVQLLLPSHSDSRPTLIIQRSRYAGLLKAGVKIYERGDEILHSKTMVIDGVWSIVGSSNFDSRSVLFNDEVDAVVIGQDTGARLQTVFRQDTQDARRIDADDWKHRSVRTRIQELFWRTWEQLL